MRADELIKRAFEAAREKEAAAAAAAAAVAAAGPPVNPIPWYFRAVPAVEISLTQGSIVICAPNLEYNTAITFRGGSGLFCVSNADYPVDLYKYEVKMSLKMAEVTLIPNKHRLVSNLQASEFIKKKQELGEKLSVQGGGDFEVEGLEQLLDSSGSDHEGRAGWTEANSFIYGNCWDAKREEFICASPECHVLQSPYMKIVYRQDQGLF